jgi:hypothetical protein
MNQITLLFKVLNVTQKVRGTPPLPPSPNKFNVEKSVINNLLIMEVAMSSYRHFATHHPTGN